jgi:hypothetical protein
MKNRQLLTVIIVTVLLGGCACRWSQPGRTMAPSEEPQATVEATEGVQTPAPQGSP